MTSTVGSYSFLLQIESLKNVSSCTQIMSTVGLMKANLIRKDQKLVSFAKIQSAPGILGLCRLIGGRSGLHFPNSL
jgi:hypothetical protein